MRPTALAVRGIGLRASRVVGPQAAGSGIPEVKAYLNGVDVPKFMQLR